MGKLNFLAKKILAIRRKLRVLASKEEVHSQLIDVGVNQEDYEKRINVKIGKMQEEISLKLNKMDLHSCLTITEIQKSLDEVVAKSNENEGLMTKMSSDIDNKFLDLRASVKKTQDSLTKKSNSLDKKVKGLESSIKDLEDNAVEVDKKFSYYNSEFRKLGGVSGRIDQIVAKEGMMHRQTSEWFTDLDRRLSELERPILQD